MDQTNAVDGTGATTKVNDNLVNDAPLTLYNDVHFKPVHTCESWAIFPRLLPELRLRVWQLFLQRHRMIELDIFADDDQDNDSQSCYYSDLNHLGNIISGRSYSLTIKGRGYAASLSPLLRVNSEARHAALEFYRTRLPFPRQDAEQVLYLNPEHDVLYVRPEEHYGRSPPRAVTVLVDFLHDVKAYDPKNQGVIHLALSGDYQMDFLERHFSDSPDPLIPAMLHPTAALSFASVLRRLRSVFCVIGFRGSMRGTSDIMVNYHFAQTIPLCRRGSPTGTFDWLESDPRLGVHLDLREVALGKNPCPLALAWAQLEKAFGVERTSTSTDDNDVFSFYICPTMSWPGPRLSRAAAQRPPEGSREELAEHLRDEAKQWDRACDYFSHDLHMGQLIVPRHGILIDAEMFEQMERAHSTAVGMWLFREGAFDKPKDLGRFCFDLSAVRPGLLLFEC